MSPRRQILLLSIMLSIYASLAFISYYGFFDQMMQLPGAEPEFDFNQRWILGLANAGLVIVVYGLLGLAGYWFARKLNWPGIYREGAGWRGWLVQPMVIGLLLGVFVVVADRFFAVLNAWDGFPHPPFPLSLIASATAGIGEEILFRAFVMGLWAYLLNRFLIRWIQAKVAFWIANFIAALAFGAAHLGSAMYLLGGTSLSVISPLIMSEIFLINGVIGLVAGERYMRQGLVAAAGIHFWTDIVWHLIWPLFINLG